MKKLFTLLLVALMTISMVACGEETTSAETNQNNSSSDNTVTQEHTLDDLLVNAQKWFKKIFNRVFNY